MDGLFFLLLDALSFLHKLVEVTMIAAEGRCMK